MFPAEFLIKFQVWFLYLYLQAYGGGGFPGSSSFIIRMDEYNQWRSALPSPIR